MEPEKNCTNIIVVGDVHGEWASLNTLINKKCPSMVISCGDFGYWPRFAAHAEEKHDFRFNVRNNGTPVYFCDGNHEDHESLRKLETSSIPGMENVFYQKRGSTFTLPDGRTVLFMGGAGSIDKESRLRGIDWFPEELITMGDIYNLPDLKVDIVISHTCPAELLDTMLEEDPRKVDDPSNAALSHVLEKYSPSLWYFGHWHAYRSGFLGSTRWYALNMADETGWWRWLDKDPWPDTKKIVIS